MRRGPFVATGLRHGHYAAINAVPDAYSGTFRTVYQHHPLPGAGAQEFTYSTFMIPRVNLYGAGSELYLGVPPATGPAQDQIAPLILSNPSQPLQGTFGRVGLLPSDFAANPTGSVG